MYRSLPVAERNRRWDALRVAMRDAGLDGLLVPIGNGSDSLYLTSVRGSAIFFSAYAPDPAVVMDQGQSNDWVPDPIQTIRAWGEPTIRAMRSTEISSGTVGIAGLGSGQWTHVDAGDGAVIHEPIVSVIEAFPRVTFVDATDVVGLLRAQKSAAELELLTEAANLAEAAITAGAQRIEPGVAREEILAAVVGRALELGSEFRPSSVYLQRPDGSATQSCESGGQATLDATGCVSGYTVTARRSFAIGRPTPYWDAALATSDHLKRALLDELRPGVTPHRLIAVAEEVGLLRDASVSLQLNGLGVGSDGPVVTDCWMSKHALRTQLIDGMCLSLTLDVRQQGAPTSLRSSLNVTINGVRAQSLTPDASVQVTA